MDIDISKKVMLALVGRSGSGKGTQAKRIMEHLGQGAHHVETGKILRNIIERDNVTARNIADILKKGDLVPSWLAAFLWISEFVDKGVADRNLVFDGSPRTVGEAKILDEAMEFHGRPLSICINVEVSEEDVTRRLLERGRSDDNPAAIKGRMEYFLKFVVPVIDYYKTNNRLITVDGSVNPDAVWEAIDGALKERIPDVWQQQ